MGNPRYLTKSRYKLAKECPTKLYYMGKKQYENQSLDDPFLRALAFGGFQVGELAKIYYPGGRMIDTLDYEQSLAATSDLLALSNVTIYEAAFRHKNLFVRVDVLVKKGNRIELIEVKSKSFDPSEESPFYDKTALKRGSRRIKESWLPYLEDIAYQTYVAQRANPSMTIEPYLLMADKSKNTSVEGLNQRFLLLEGNQGRLAVKVKEGTSVESVGTPILCKIAVTDEVQLLFDRKPSDAPPLTFEEEIEFFARSYDDDIRIAPSIGTSCKTCEFRSTDLKQSGFYECWSEASKLTPSELAEPLVYDVWNFRKAKELISSGIYLMKNIPLESLKVNEGDGAGMSSSQRQVAQIEACIKGDMSPYIDREGLKAALKSWTFPLHFIDFETTMVAIPFTKDRRPYEQVAFQFSHHQVARDGTITHKGQYINERVGIFPNFDFLRALKRELELDSGTILRYATHENTVLCQIYDQLAVSSETDRDELCSWIKTITTSNDKNRGLWHGARSMVDMCDLVKRHYYHPLTNGSNSIKKVLPAVLQESLRIKQRFAQPLYGTKDGMASLNFVAWQWVQFDESGAVIDPYKLLPPIFEGIDTDKLDLLLGSDELAEGGAAMIAYAKMQFSEMSQTERSAIVSALLRYCELDTLAMVLLYEHWLEIVLEAGAELVA